MWPKAIKKVSIRCSLSSEIQWYHLFSCATFRTCDNMHLNFCSIMNLTSILKNEKSGSLSHFLIYQTDNCYRGSPWGYFGRVFCVFFEKLKIFGNIFKKIFRKNFCDVFSFLKILKIRDSSFVAPSILRPLMPKNGPSSKTVPSTTILVEPYFASKSIEHDVTLTSFSADLW